MKKLNVDVSRNNNTILSIIFVIFLMFVSGWGQCTYIAQAQTFTGPILQELAGCDVPLDCSGYVPPSGTYVCSTIIDDQGCRYASECPDGWRQCTYKYVSCSAYVTSDKCVADSIACISIGNIWQADPLASCGKSCKINHCKAADSTWLSTSIAACTGSNNYAIVNTDSTCEHVGTCCPNDSIPSGMIQK